MWCLWISQFDGTKSLTISLYSCDSAAELNVCSKNSASRMKSQNMSRSMRLSIPISICLPTFDFEEFDQTRRSYHAPARPSTQHQRLAFPADRGIIRALCVAL